MDILALFRIWKNIMVQRNLEEVIKKSELFPIFWINQKEMKLSAVRIVLEILLFQELGSFETLGSKLSHGTSKKVADVRTHLREVS